VKDVIVRRWRALVIEGVIVLLVLAGSAVAAAGDRNTVTVDEDRTTTLALPGGGVLIIPPHTMKDGARVSGQVRAEQPGGSHEGIRLLGRAVEIVADPPDAIIKDATLNLRMPVPADAVPQGMDPAVWLGISTYDPATNSWRPETAKYEESQHIVSALISHFSWWNPFSWNFEALGSKILQRVGEWRDKRAPAPTCSGALPPWVDGIAGLSDKDNVAIRACGQSDGDSLDIEMVNNRPYGQVVHLGHAVTARGHATPDTVGVEVMTALVDLTMDDGEFYVPPLTRASLTIGRLGPAEQAAYHIGPTLLTIGADLAAYLIEPLDLLGPIIGPLRQAWSVFRGCRVDNSKQRLNNPDTAGMWSSAISVMQCVLTSLKSAQSQLGLKKEQLDRLAAAAQKYAKAVIKANGVRLAEDAVWEIGDLLGDWYAHRNSANGNGFNVKGKEPAPVSPTPPPRPPKKDNGWQWYCWIPPLPLYCLFK
jgi:hypothetical protein